MNSALQLYDSTDSSLNPTLSFTAVQNGTPSAAQTLHLWNDFGLVLSADDAEDVLIWALSSESGAGEHSAEHELAANRWIEVRAVGVTGTGIEAQTTAWTPIGKAATLSLRTIPANCARYLEVRINIPAGAGSRAGDVLILATDGGIAQALGDGHYEGSSGVLAGLGDANVSQLLSGAVFSPSGPADDNVTVSTAIGVVSGYPFCLVEHQETFTDVDGDAATLAAGESYGATLSILLTAGVPSVTQTKGSKVTGSPTPDDYPEVPDGELFIGHVEVPYGLAIDTGQLDQTTVKRGGYDLTYSASSLGVTVSGGRAICGNALLRSGLGTDLTLAASDETWIWVQPNGQIAQSLTDVAPTARSLALWKVTTDGSGVTAVVDLRTWTGPNVGVLPFQQRGTLAANDYTYATLPLGGPCYIFPLGGVVMGLGDEGGTSGSTVGDLEWASDTATPTWTTLYTSSGSVDLRPTLAHDAGLMVAKGDAPEVLVLPGGAMVRWKVVSVPGTASTNLFGQLRFCQPGS